jgi:hypothetical protein
MTYYICMSFNNNHRYIQASLQNDLVFEHKMHIFGIQIQSFNHIVYNNNINNNCCCYDFECLEQYSYDLHIFIDILHCLLMKI